MYYVSTRTPWIYTYIYTYISDAYIFTPECVRANVHTRVSVCETQSKSQRRDLRVHNNLFRALLLRTTAVGRGPVAAKCAWVYPLCGEDVRYYVVTAAPGSPMNVDENGGCALTKPFFISHCDLRTWLFVFSMTLQIVVPPLRWAFY